jgi:GTP-binding protein
VLLDPSTLQDDPPGRQLEVLLEELLAHNPKLAAMPRIVAVSKSDVLGGEGIAAFGLGEDVIGFSGLTGEGIDELMYRVASIVESVEHSTPEREGYVLHRPLRDDFTIRRDGPQWVVEGLAAVRAVNLSDLTDPDAADFVSQRLERSGIVQGLRDAGATSGDDVRIGSIVFTFEPELDEDEDFQV